MININCCCCRCFVSSGIKRRKTSSEDAFHQIKITTAINTSETFLILSAGIVFCFLCKCRSCADSNARFSSHIVYQKMVSCLVSWINKTRVFNLCSLLIANVYVWAVVLVFADGVASVRREKILFSNLNTNCICFSFPP